MTGAMAAGRSSVDSDGLQVLPLTTAHLDEVLTIETRVAEPGWSRAVFERELAAGGTRCYLAAVLALPTGSAVVGYAGVQVLVDEAHITTLTVEPSRRRHGIGSRLLVCLLRSAIRRGASSATLEVRSTNAMAQRLYAGFGFRPVGVRPRYYAGTTDALIMWAHDIDGDAYDGLLAEHERRLGMVSPDGGEAAAC